MTNVRVAENVEAAEIAEALRMIALAREKKMVNRANKAIETMDRIRNLANDLGAIIIRTNNRIIVRMFFLPDDVVKMLPLWDVSTIVLDDDFPYKDRCFAANFAGLACCYGTLAAFGSTMASLE